MKNFEYTLNPVVNQLELVKKAAPKGRLLNLNLINGISFWRSTQPPSLVPSSLGMEHRPNLVCVGIPLSF
jgi:hypothetical protein